MWKPITLLIFSTSWMASPVLIQTEAMEEADIVAGSNPVTGIGENTPATLLSGTAYVVLFVNGVGPTEPTALVEPLKVRQPLGHTVPPLPASTIGNGFTVTD